MGNGRYKCPKLPKNIVMNGHKTNIKPNTIFITYAIEIKIIGEHSGSVVEHQTREEEVGDSKPSSAVLCP